MRLSISIVALAMVAYHLAYAQFPIWGVDLHSNAHLGFSLLLLYLFFIQQSKSRVLRSVLFLLLLLSLVSTTYIVVYYDELMLRQWFNTPVDLAIGVVLMIVTLEAARRGVGLLIPALGIAAVLYPFIGSHLVEPFRVTSYPLGITISDLSVSLGGGIYSTALTTSAVYLFLFIVFGGVLQGAGATRFFLQLGRLAGAKLRGGPAMMSVVSSSSVGMITGSALANIGITGSFTIPLMKKVGYTPEQAGAIEAAASTGGQIMPPIMGAVAFLMAGMTGIPYLRVMMMAVVPALLYYIALGWYVQLQAQKLKILPVVERVDIGELLSSAPLFVVPLGVIIALFVAGKTVLYVSFWAIISVIIIGVIPALVKRQGLSYLKNIVSGLVRGARGGAEVAVITGSIGLLLTSFEMSGLGVKLSSGIQAWSGGYLFVAMLMVQAVCILMGMGGVAVTSYLIVSMFAVPAMVKLGVPLDASHFFCLFPAVFAVLTPPIAVAAVVACRMAGGEYRRTAWEACKAAIGGFTLPFMFVYAPILLLSPSAPAKAVTDLIASILFFITSECGLVGYYLTDCNWLERILLCLTSALLFAYLPLNQHILFTSGMALFAVLTLWQWSKRRSLSKNQQQMLG